MEQVNDHSQTVGHVGERLRVCARCPVTVAAAAHPQVGEIGSVFGGFEAPGGA
jgi:hypothetical protein